NPDFIDAPNPYIDELVLAKMSDDSQQWASFDQREVDVLGSTLSDSIDRAEDCGVPSVGVPQVITNLITFNQAVAPLDDARVREAFAMVLDRATLCQARNSGVACETTPDTLFAPGTRYHDASVSFPALDHDAAQALIDEYVAENGEINV